MAKYEITAPDGTRHEVTAPDNASEQEVMAFAQKSFSNPQSSPVVGNPKDASVMNRIGVGIADPVHGGAQALTHMLPDKIVNSVNEAMQYVNDLPVVGPITKALGMTPATSQQLDQRIQQREQQYQADRKSAGQGGFDAARLAGNIIPMLATAGRLPEGTSLLGKTISSTIGSGLSSAAAPITQGNYADEKRRQIMLASALGAVTPAVAQAASRIIRPETNEAAKKLMDQGVTPTPGQILGGTAKSIEDKATSIPLLGDMIKNSQVRANEDFNRAAYAKALQAIGKKPSGAVGHEGVLEVKTALKDAYDDVLPKLQFKADQEFAKDISSLTSNIQNGNVPPEISKQFNSILKNEVFSRMTKQGAMDGQSFKSMESALTPKIKSFSSSMNPNDRDLGAALEEVLKSARGALERSNPKYAKELSNINLGYANYARIRNAASSLGAADGVFSPSQLASAVKSLDKSAGKGNFSTGTALMQDLSKAGKSVLPSQIPNSGTADRMAIGAMPAILSGTISPYIPAALGATMLPYTATGQKLMAKLLTQRPAAAAPIAEAVRRSVPAIGAATYPAIQGGQQ